jgi:hypothetical protein
MNDGSFGRTVNMPGESAAQASVKAMVMMLPNPWAIIMGAACFIPNITARTAVSNTKEKCSVATSVILTMGEPLPALLTRQSSRPNRATA